MATSAMSYHVRSNSVPSRSHPLISQFEENLCRLRSSTEATSTSSSISQQLNGLQDLHNCVEELLLLPHVQQAISHDSVGGLLDGSLRLLDVCNIIKEALLQTKESAQEIQSVLRRRCKAESEVKCFLSTRKVAKKAIQKTLKSLKDMNNKCSSDQETVALLGEAQALAVIVLESFLSFINGKKATSWSMLSKLVQSKRVGCEDGQDNEFAMVDAAVQSLIHHKGSAENVQNQLQKLESCVQDFDDVIESLFRQMIKTRVSLLNIINH